MRYLDHAASTPMRPEAIAAMAAFLAEQPGNPSGSHGVARAAKYALEEARERVAALLGCAPGEVVFTGGGSEADNLAVKGAARAAARRRAEVEVVTTTFEHKAVLASVERLETEGLRAHRVRVTPAGLVDLDALRASLSSRTAVVSVMLVNNEVGTIQPLDVVAALVREHAPDALLHTDAVQAVPWLDVAAHTAGCDLVSVSGHKFGGPKGVGALVVRDGVDLLPEIEGGGQERDRRSGTVNVAGVVAFATALEVTHAQRAVETERIGMLRDRLAAGLCRVPGSFVNGGDAHRVAGCLPIGFRGVESEVLLALLDAQGLCAAAGSSCASGATDPSHVLAAMGLTHRDALASIRLSLGSTSTEADVDAALTLIPAAVEQLRAVPTVAAVS